MPGRTGLATQLAQKSTCPPHEGLHSVLLSTVRRREKRREAREREGPPLTGCTRIAIP